MSKTETYLRIRDIVGNRAKGIPAIFPVSESTWWAGVRSGRFPPSIKIGPRLVVWRRSDIDALIDRAAASCVEAP